MPYEHYERTISGAFAMTSSHTMISHSVCYMQSVSDLTKKGMSWTCLYIKVPVQKFMYRLYERALGSLSCFLTQYLRLVITSFKLVIASFKLDILVYDFLRTRYNVFL